MESLQMKDSNREAFEKECRLLGYKGNMAMSNLGSFYNDEQTNWMWQMWLSSKAKAVPEGFVLVPKEPTQTMLDSARDWSAKKYGKAVGNDGASGCYKAMIEAQEPTND